MKKQRDDPVKNLQLGYKKGELGITQLYNERIAVYAFGTVQKYTSM